jgi:Outer membrane lipoprotein carrier protein LolA-like
MRVAIVFALAAMLALTSPSLADVAAICPTLTSGQTLHGRFVQEQHLKGLTAPLRTEGDFVVVPDLGIIWRSAQPVQSVTVITAAGIKRIVDRNEVQRLASSKIPAFAHLYELIDRAMTGDWSAMEKDFTLESTGDRTAWRISLTPLRSEGPLASRLTSVILTGDGRIDTVDINRANGDSTHVAFLDQVVSSSPLTDPDARLLNDKWE